MSKRDGQILEAQIRRSSYSISEIAGLMGVDRRTIYNLFSTKDVKTEYIIQIGNLIKYDFSYDFPNKVKHTDFNFKPLPASSEENRNNWKDRYIELLEKYTKLLNRMIDEDK
ncbi:hypothetical protein FPZ43_11265 [Mucilaginibacter pallidiroseus]|uniref:Uncharacterized protein n=1 Tax=Mucilaginibacter pallidiroseus TaxID=2599295 RepID=A0A563UBU3_9SPHI|nr:hypothetical protein [Mucilaginibacter pallidiroseus]TWR28842.1 hypothetical protein FPZ43_11265 [Mucilaginibacter pallidiroseus]